VAMETNPKACEIATLLEGYRFSWVNEGDLQTNIAMILAGRFDYEREVALNARDRVDFMVGRIGIECKVAHSATQVIRQLIRYVESPLVDEIILVTTRHSHQTIPTEMGGKSIHVVYLLSSLI
jgi:hypothetical protein